MRLPTRLISATLNDAATASAAFPENIGMEHPKKITMFTVRDKFASNPLLFWH